MKQRIMTGNVTEVKLPPSEPEYNSYREKRKDGCFIAHAAASGFAKFLDEFSEFAEKQDRLEAQRAKKDKK